MTSSERKQNEKPGATPSSIEREDIALVFAPDGSVAHLLGDTYRPRRGQARVALRRGGRLSHGYYRSLSVRSYRVATLHSTRQGMKAVPRY